MVGKSPTEDEDETRTRIWLDLAVVGISLLVPNILLGAVAMSVGCFILGMDLTILSREIENQHWIFKKGDFQQRIIASPSKARQLLKELGPGWTKEKVK